MDAGVFLGASTRCPAAGLRASASHRPADRPRLRSFDLCLCDDYMAGLINERHGTRLKAGDSFEPFLRDNLVDLRGEVDLRVGDIRDIEPADDVEILFLDVCKDPAINAHVVASFFPRLIPGVSVLVHQDFVHESLPWIHVSMGVLADHFAFAGVVGEFGPSAVYLCTRAVPETVRDVYGFASLPVLGAAFGTAVSPLDPVQRYFVDMAYARLLAGRGLSKMALAEMDRLDSLHDQLRRRYPYLPTTERHRARLHTRWATDP